MRTRWLNGWRGRVIWCAVVAMVCGAAGVLLPLWGRYHRAPDPTGGAARAAERGVIVDRIDSSDEVTLRVLVRRGPNRGRQFADTLFIDALQPADHLPSRGERVFCQVAATQPTAGRVTTRVREWPLLVLAGVFLAGLGLIGGRSGVRTAVSLVVAVAAVVLVLLPLSRAGHDPFLVSIPVAAVVAAAGITLIAGPNVKALSAILGTLVGASLAAFLATFAGRYLAYTGLAIDFGPQLNLDVGYWYSPGLARVDFAGLLAAGILISALGATMDVSVGVASAAAEVRAGAPQIGPWRVALAGLRVGRDMMGLMAAALVFIYLGGGMMGFLALRSIRTVSGWLELMSYEAVGAEVVRLLAGATGLAAAIPATALAAGLLMRRRRPNGA